MPFTVYRAEYGNACRMPNWRFPQFDWDDGNIEHLIQRHNVFPDEVEDVFANRTIVRRVGSSYEVLGRDAGGRYLFLVCVERFGRIRVFSARDMNDSERRRYARN